MKPHSSMAGKLSQVRVTSYPEDSGDYVTLLSVSQSWTDHVAGDIVDLVIDRIHDEFVSDMSRVDGETTFENATAQAMRLADQLLADAQLMGSLLFLSCKRGVVRISGVGWARVWVHAKEKWQLVVPPTALDIGELPANILTSSLGSGQIDARLLSISLQDSECDELIATVDWKVPSVEQLVSHLDTIRTGSFNESLVTVFALRSQ